MQDLFQSTLTMVGYRDAFFLWPERARTEFPARIAAATRRDPEWTAAFLAWLRAETPMRYPALVGAAAFAAARLADGSPGRTRQVVGSVLRRADDPGHLLALWRAAHGRAVPKPVKRGVADAVARLYDEDALRLHDTGAHNFALPSFPDLRGLFSGTIDSPPPFRFGDVIRVVHPVPRDAQQSAVFRQAMAGRREPLGDSDLMLDALLGRLHHLDKHGLPFETAMEINERLADPAEVRAARLYPLRLAAARRAAAAQRWTPTLERAAGYLLDDLPRIPGRTLITIDQEFDDAAVFGLTLAQRCEHADVVAHDGRRFPVVPGESPLHGLHRWRAFGLPATYCDAPVRDAFAGHDRVAVIDPYVDEPPDLGVPVYAWRVNGYRAGESRPPRLVFPGLTDEALALIPVIEAAREGVWPFTTSRGA
ncbi:hypothetical protein [Actinomadura hibisca]|uniref:hypothetical protein n=1 Tax=Actinomadura hibisca TaxID=68565 RepID=UPI00082D9818|nr:hypothetical protein [Actinomadura hibisca]